MANIRKNKTSTFTAQVRIAGFPHVSKTFRTRGMANAWAIKVEDAMRSGNYKSVDNTTVKELLDRYLAEIVPLKKTTKSHKTNLKNLSVFLGDYKVTNLDPDSIVSYVKHRSKTVSSSTILKEINTLNHSVRTGIALWNIVCVNPVPIAKDILSVTKALSPSKPRNRRLEDGEEDRLINALSQSPQTQAIALITLSTARRLKEILALNDSLITRRNNKTYIKVKDSKTDKDIEIPLPESISHLLISKKNKIFNIQSDSVSQAFNRACNRTGIADLRLTDLRHEALSRLFERGFTVPEVMAISGHSSPDLLLKVYAQVQTDKLAEKLDK